MNQRGLAVYLRENYGLCGAEHCRCRCSRPNCGCGGGVWKGTTCPDWQPAIATTFTELADWQAEVRR